MDFLQQCPICLGEKSKPAYRVGPDSSLSYNVKVKPKRKKKVAKVMPKMRRKVVPKVMPKIERKVR
jgi:hypothetical protein